MIVCMAEKCTRLNNESTTNDRSEVFKRRLALRKSLYNRLVIIGDLMCALAVLGIVLMIIETEYTFHFMGERNPKLSWFIQLIITTSTIVIVVLIFYYHYIDLSICSNRNAVKDWRIELTTSKILLIIVEVLVCIIHPVPRSYPRSDPAKIPSNSSSSNLDSISYISVNVGLGLPMFLRLYLLGRSAMLHSNLVRHIILRSFGYLNRVSIDFYFLIRIYLEQWPARCLFAFYTLIFLIGSWALRACDYDSTGGHLSLSDSMWLFVTTFTAVGYGDQYPSTYCGRSIATIIALLGYLTSGVLSANIAQKLLLTRDERYTHTFTENIQLGKEHRNHAANVIKFLVKRWYLKRHDHSASLRYLQTQQKLARSIHQLQETRQKRRNLVDHCVDLTELISTHHDIGRQTEETAGHIATIKLEVNEVTQELHNVHSSVKLLQNTLEVLLNSSAN